MTENFYEQEDLGTCPDSWDRLEWEMSIGDSQTGTILAEIVPNYNPVWLGVARRWQKKYIVSFREAMDLAKKFTKLFQLEHYQLKEFENSYSSWEELKEWILEAEKKLEETETPPTDFISVAEWLSATDREKLKRLYLSLVREINMVEEEIEEKEHETWINVSCFKSLPVGPLVDWEAEEGLQREKAERLEATKALSRRDFIILRHLAGGNWAKAKRAFGLFLKRKEFVPPYWRERAFYKWEAQRERFKKIRQVSFEHLSDQIKKGLLGGKALYEILKKNTVLTSAQRSELWKIYKQVRGA